MNEGELTVLNSRFVNNRGGGYLGQISRGGAIANGNILLVKNSEFEGNFVYNDFNSGGAISSAGTLRVEESSFHDNNGDNGGAIHNYGQAEIVNTRMTENSATYGSAIDSVGELDLINSVLENNEAYRVEESSGTIIVAGTTHIVDTRISGNSASYGAALDNRGGEGENTGSTMITGSIISGNTAVEGGGAIFNHGDLTITDSTISGNEAGNYAGAIYNKQTAVVEIENSTISGNTLGDSVWAYAVSALYTKGR